MNSDVSFRRIFLVSNRNLHFCQTLTSFFSPKFKFSVFSSKEESFQNIHQRPSCIFLEVNDESTSSLNFIDEVNDFDKNIPIVLILNNNNITPHIFLSKTNVFDYYYPNELTQNRLFFLQKNIERVTQLQNQLDTLEAKKNHDHFKKIVYNCEPMQRVTQLVKKASNTNISCYLSGEKGTGKCSLANIIHILSKRRNHSLVKLNLNSLNQDEIETQLFGFENKTQDVVQKGKIELANNSTLLIENIDLMPLSIQIKLLDFFDTKVFHRINGNEIIASDVRFIISSEKSLFEEMNAGNFLESLYYRMMGLPIPLPPLRERGNDILLLSNICMNDFIERNHFEKKLLSKEAKKKLLSYSFPGNITELKSTIERAIVLSSKNIITEDDIEFINNSNQLSFLDQDMTFEEYKSKIIHHYLKKYNNDIMLISNKLDIGKSTIYRMLKSEKEKSSRKMSWFNLF